MVQEKQNYEKSFFLYRNKRAVVTVSCGSTLSVFAFGSAKIPSSFLRDLAFLTRYLETSNSFIVFSIVQLSGVKVNSLILSVLPTYINHYISNFLLKFQVAILQLKCLCNLFFNINFDAFQFVSTI